MCLTAAQEVQAMDECPKCSYKGHKNVLPSGVTYYSCNDCQYGWGWAGEPVVAVEEDPKQLLGGFEGITADDQSEARDKLRRQNNERVRRAYNLNKSKK
jgi:hypothetical protein